MRTSLIAIVVLVGCGKKQPSLDDALAQWKPKVEPKLTRVEEIAKNLSKVDPAKPLATPRSVIETMNRKIEGDTLITYRADLEALLADKAPPTDYDRHTSSTDLVACWHVMKKKQYGSFALSDSTYGPFSAVPAKGFQVSLLCDTLAHASHLAVVTPAKTTGGTTEHVEDVEKAAPTFEAYKAEGVIDVFDLATGGHAGRVAYAATNSKSVNFKSVGGADTGDLTGSLQKDIRERTWSAQEDALLKR